VGRRCIGQELARLAGKEKYENINDLGPGGAGDDCFRTNVQSADRAATAGESNAYTAANLATQCPGSRSASNPRGQSAPDAQPGSPGAVRNMGGQHVV